MVRYSYNFPVKVVAGNRKTPGRKPKDTVWTQPVVIALVFVLGAGGWGLGLFVVSGTTRDRWTQSCCCPWDWHQGVGCLCTIQSASDFARLSVISTIWLIMVIVDLKQLDVCLFTGELSNCPPNFRKFSLYSVSLVFIHHPSKQTTTFRCWD